MATSQSRHTNGRRQRMSVFLAIRLILAMASLIFCSSAKQAAQRSGRVSGQTKKCRQQSQLLEEGCAFYVDLGSVGVTWWLSVTAAASGQQQEHPFLASALSQA